MPRFRRYVHPGDLVHVISRFVNREIRVQTDEERAELLRRLSEAIVDSDWTMVSYALMGNHIHMGLLAGSCPFERLTKRAYSPFVRWLNNRHDRLGPLFAGRPSTIVVDPAWAERLIAYHHNNPARAGVVEHAAQSTWTSHRAYVGLDTPTAGLAVDVGLSLVGLSDDAVGRGAFDAWVRQRLMEPRDIRLTGDAVAERRKLRERLQASVCLAHPTTGPHGLDYAPRAPARRWGGEIAAVVDVVATEIGINPLAITSGRRERALSAARRQVALVGAELGATNREVGLALGISEAAVRKLRHRARPEDRSIAARVLERVLGSAA